MSNINYNDILTNYGIDENTTLSQLLTMYDNLKVVSNKEINSITSISVKTLPNQVRNMADNVKKRMYGIVTDENNGAVALMSKRFAIIYKIISKLDGGLTSVTSKANTTESSLNTFLNTTLPTLQKKSLTQDYTLGDKTTKDIETLLDTIVEYIKKVVNGTIVVSKATNADNATNATNSTNATNATYATKYKDNGLDKDIKDNINSKLNKTIEEQTFNNTKYTNVETLLKAITSELNSFLYLTTNNNKIDTFKELASQLDGVANSLNNVLVNGGLPTATTTTLGAVKIGSGINVNDGTISVDTYSQSDINTKDTNTLNSAKTYADGVATTAENNAKAYTYSKSDIDTKASNAESNAKAYTYSKSDVDTKDTSTLNSAKAYTDSEIAKIDKTTFEATTTNALAQESITLEIPNESNALITKVVGNTARASDNLFDDTIRDYASNQLCFGSDFNGNVYLSSGTYTFSIDTLTSYTLLVKNLDTQTTYQSRNSSLTFTCDSGNYLILAYGNSITSTTSISHAMLNKGSTALPYTQYNNNIINSNGSVVSVGKNLFDKDNATLTSGIAFNSSRNTFFNWSDGKIKSISLTSGTYTYTGIYVACYTINAISSNNEYTLITSGTSFTITSNATFCVYDEANEFTNIMLNIGSTALSYTPYTQDTINLLELGKWDTWENGKLTKQTSIVVIDGNAEFYEWKEATNHYQFLITNHSELYGTTDIVNNQDFGFKTSTIYGDSATYIAITSNEVQISIPKEKLSSFSNSSAKAYFSNNPLHIAYKLSTPTITETPMPNGFKVFKNGLIKQTATLPYTITKRFAVNIAEQLLNNVDMDKQQQRQIDVVNVDIDEIKQRLDELGFEEGVAVINSGVASVNSIKKQGKYILFNLTYTINGSQGDSLSSFIGYIRIPKQFCPNETKHFYARLKATITSGSEYGTETLSPLYCNLLSSGYINFVNNQSDYVSRRFEITLLNVGWELE